MTFLIPTSFARKEERAVVRLIKLMQAMVNIKTAMMDRLTGKDPAVEKQFESMEPVGRMGTAEEIAEAVVWLCSDAASFITGHSMAVDGGMVAQ